MVVSSCRGFLGQYMDSPHLKCWGHFVHPTGRNMASSEVAALDINGNQTTRGKL